MRFCSWFFVQCILIGAIGAEAFAQAPAVDPVGECRRGLVQNTFKRDWSEDAKIAWIWSIDEGSYDAAKRDVETAGDAIYLGYFAGSANYRQFDENRRNRQESESLRADVARREALLRVSVSDVARAGFYDCVKQVARTRNAGLVMWVENETETAFTLAGHYRSVAGRSAPVQIKIEVNGQPYASRIAEYAHDSDIIPINVQKPAVGEVRVDGYADSHSSRLLVISRPAPVFTTARVVGTVDGTSCNPSDLRKCVVHGAVGMWSNQAEPTTPGRYNILYDRSFESEPKFEAVPIRAAKGQTDVPVQELYLKTYNESPNGIVIEFRRKFNDDVVPTIFAFTATGKVRDVK